MTIMEYKCKKAGLPTETTKTAGPSSKITFLGMELDTVARVVRLPCEKLQELQELLDTWHGKKNRIKKDQQSIVGLLNHTCKAVHSVHKKVN